MKLNHLYWLDGEAPCTIGEIVNDGEAAIVYGHGTTPGWSGVVSVSRLLSHANASRGFPPQDDPPELEMTTEA